MKKQNTILVVASITEHAAIRLSDFSSKDADEIALTYYKETDSSDKQLRGLVKILLKSFVLVTVGNWYDTETLSKLVKIARIMGIPVVNKENFDKYDQSGNN